MEEKIDYGDLPFDKQRKLDKIAYQRYFEKYFSLWKPSNDDLEWSINLLSFNEWYGSDEHRSGLRILMRKYKLKKIEKKNGLSK